MKRMLSVVLSMSLAVGGCAAHAGTPLQAAPFGAPARADLATYARQLPLGSRVRVERTNHGPLRGTLLRTTPEMIVVQQDTRIPEPPVEVPLDAVTRITVDAPRAGLGKAIAIGAAVGAGAVLVFLSILAATLRD